MTKRILITGGAGFIGSHLVDFLIESSKYEVTVFDCLDEQIHGKIDKPPSYLNKNIKFIRGSVNSYEKFEEVVKENDIVFHLAAQPYILPSWEDPVDTIETNVVGTINVFESIKKHNLRTKVILACTSTEYGTTAQINRPLKETDSLLAIHPYGISKVASELLNCCS